MATSGGLVYIHSAPQSLLAHIEWTISGVSGSPQKMIWVKSVLDNTQSQAVSFWAGKEGDGAILASALMNLKQISFEITQTPNGDSEGYRWSFTPNLGMFSSVTDSAGNILISENRLRLAMEKAGSNALILNRELRKLLGQEFDDELEESRGAALLIAAEGDDSVMATEPKRVANSQEV
jgi:hypothetical protein